MKPPAAPVKKGNDRAVVVDVSPKTSPRAQPTEEVGSPLADSAIRCPYKGVPKDVAEGAITDISATWEASEWVQ